MPRGSEDLQPRERGLAGAILVRSGPERFRADWPPDGLPDGRPTSHDPRYRGDPSASRPAPAGLRYIGLKSRRRWPAGTGGGGGPLAAGTATEACGGHDRK